MTLPLLPAPYTANFAPTLYANLDTWRQSIENKAEANHTHGGSSVVLSIVANQAALGTGATYGEGKITADTGHRWVWMSPGVWTDLDKIATPLISTAVPMNGDIRGGDITKTAANQLTIQPVACLDSTGTVAMDIQTATVLSTPTTSNYFMHLAVVRLISTGLCTIMAYASEAAIAADVGVTINAWRWLDWWENTGTVLKQGFSKAGTHWWGAVSENILFTAVTPPAGCSTAVNIGATTGTKIPGNNRVSHALIGGQSTNVNTVNIVLGFDGTNAATCFWSHGTNGYNGNNDVNAWYDNAYASPCFIPLAGTSIYWGYGSLAPGGTVNLALHAAVLRR